MHVQSFCSGKRNYDAAAGFMKTFMGYYWHISIVGRSEFLALNPRRHLNMEKREPGEGSIKGDLQGVNNADCARLNEHQREKEKKDFMQRRSRDGRRLKQKTLFSYH